MEIIAKNERLCIRKMEPTVSDFQQHLTWMTDPEVLKYWDGDYDYDAIVKEYRHCQEEGVTQCFIELYGRAIGYVQFDRIPDAAGYECPADDWARFIGPEETVYGIDMFIADVSCRNRGIGTEMLTMLGDALFENYGADALVVDPKTHLAHAIRCYHKCGFRDCFVVPLREAHYDEMFDSLIMCKKKSLHNS